MEILFKENIQKLSETRQPNCVSLYFPTEQTGREIRQGPIRLKNLLKQAEEHLQKQNVSSDKIRSLLQPAEQLVEDVDFWQHQSSGLALFLATNQFLYFRLPLEFPELVVVTDHFHIKPLFQLVSNDGKFFVLALSQNQIRFLQGTRQSISELDGAGVRVSLAEALKYDDPEVSLQFRQGGAEAGEGRAAIFHGHGAGEDEQKNRLLRYFQQINNGLQGLLATEKAPLILAGVDYYFPIYREANSYNYLLEEGIEGNPEHLDAKELHTRAWQLVEPVFQKKVEEAKENYQLALSKNQASSDLKQVVRAAQQGRVDTLFVAREQNQWGALDPNQNSIHVHDSQQPGDEDLLDYAASQTFSTGGVVYVLDQEMIPDKGMVAAIFRY